MSSRARDRQLFAPAVGSPTPTAGGGGAQTANANNTGGTLKARTLGPAATVSVACTITPKVSGKFQLLSFLSAIDVTDNDPCTYQISDGTNVVAAGNLVSDATAGNVNVFPSTIANDAGANYPLGVAVTFTLSITSTGGHNLTTTAAKCNIDAIELAG